MFARDAMRASELAEKLGVRSEAVSLLMPPNSGQLPHFAGSETPRVQRSGPASAGSSSRPRPGDLGQPNCR